MARASSASMTTASSGSLPRRKVTTQSSQAVVSRSVQQSQSMVSPPSGSVPLLVTVSLVIGMSLTLSVCPHRERGL